MERWKCDEIRLLRTRKLSRVTMEIVNVALVLVVHVVVVKVVLVVKTSSHEKESILKKSGQDRRRNWDLNQRTTHLLHE